MPLVLNLRWQWIAFYLSAFVLLGLGVLYIFTVNATQPIPDNLHQTTQSISKPQLLDRRGIPLTVTYQNEWNVHDQIALHEVPSLLQHAFIYAEDKRFYEHNGIDWTARFNAVWQNLVALKSLRGASTISEQVIRMLRPRPRTLWSRWLEGWEAQALEAKFDKATIFEFYLNQIPYASQRRGIQQAATHYFDRDISTLNSKEMLALAVLVRAPSRFDLYKDTERIEGRLSTLADRLQRAGLISINEKTKQSALTLTKPKPDIDALHFAHHILQKSGNRNDKQIQTTLDAEIQMAGQQLLSERLNQLQSKNVNNAAMLVIDHTRSEVLAWVNASTGDGEAYDAVLVPRQPGSTLKPFVYATALERGWTASTMIEDAPLKEGVGFGAHSYRNYSNTYYGDISLREALGNSLNIPAIKAVQFVGSESLHNKLNQMGVNQLALRSVDYGNGIALGNAELSLFALAQAYTTLANRGMYAPLRTTLSPNSVITQQQVFSPQVSSIISNILSDPNARALEFGRGSVLNLPVQTAMKTGTSNDYRDAWIVGYNYRYVVAIWMGNLDNRPMQSVTGSLGPALVARAMFARLNRGKTTQPLYLSRQLAERSVCIDSGELANRDCASRMEWFDSNHQPTKPRPAASQHQPAFRYKIEFPFDRMHIARDPRIPDDSESIEFQLSTSDQVKTVEWFLNDALIHTSTNSLENTRYQWSLIPGEHTLTARIYPHGQREAISTDAVTFTVK